MPARQDSWQTNTLPRKTRDHHSKRGGVEEWKSESLPVDLILLLFFLHHPPSSCKRWTALYSVSTGPRSQIRELLMELSLVPVYLVPSHEVQVSPFYRWTQRAGAMSYPPSNNKTTQRLQLQIPYFHYLKHLLFRRRSSKWSTVSPELSVIY